MYTQDNKIYMGLAETANGPERLYLLPEMANRHGLIAGATGTGKTVSMKVMAESFSDMGVPVFMADIKGDLSGTAFPGKDSEDMQERIQRFGIVSDFRYSGYPVRFFDIFKEAGLPVRVTISSLGPVLLSRLLGLTEVQEGVLNIVFRVADEHGLLLLDLKDLQSMLNFVGENAKEFTLTYGNISSASIGAIQRALLSLENEGATCMFGEPELDINDLLTCSEDGRGVINILESTKLFSSPNAYSVFLLWLLTELYENLPEVGDLDKPKFVFFFDEAHALFADASKALVSKIEQVVRLVRSKGVGVYFVTQSPSDIPDSVLAQLSNRIQHGLRAYTPAEQKKLKAASDAFRENEHFNTQDELMKLGTGEALVSFLDKKGIPNIVEVAKILPPQSYMGIADWEKLESRIKNDRLASKYAETIDRESAYEILQKARVTMAEEEAAEQEKIKEEKAVKAAEKKTTAKTSTKKSTASKTAEKAAAAAASAVAAAVSRNIVNSVAGGKKVSAQEMAKRAASNALSSVMRGSAKSIVRGLFGNIK